jgi:hypothetical protein
MSNTYAIQGPTLESVYPTDRHFKANTDSEAISVLNDYGSEEGPHEFDLYKLDQNSGYWSWVQTAEFKPSSWH